VNFNRLKQRDRKQKTAFHSYDEITSRSTACYLTWVQVTIHIIIYIQKIQRRVIH